MARFYFHVQDGRELLDRDGVEIRSLVDVRRMAVEYAGALIKDEAARFWNGAGWQMDVTDENGQTLLTLGFSATVAEQREEAFPS